MTVDGGPKKIPAQGPLFPGPSVSAGTGSAAVDSLTALADAVGAASVPSPGPGAVAPPPWNRIPGRPPIGAGAPSPMRGGPGPAGSPRASAPGQPGRPQREQFEDDGPTAYLLSDPGGAPTDPTPVPNVKIPWSSARSGRPRPPRQAALQLKRLDPWSMLKLGLVLAVVIFFIWLVAVGVLYGVLDGIGVWDRLNGTYADLVSGETPSGSPLISAGRVFGLAAVVGAINSLLFAVAVTIGAFVYNVSADLVGGVEVTLSERD